MDLFPQPLIAALQPGSYSVIDTTALASVDRTRVNQIAVLLGDARGGQPNTPLTIYSAQDIKTTLRGGELYDAARIAFEAGAVPITVVRIGTGILQGTATLAGTGGNLAALTLTTIGWGAWVNAINWQITIAGVLTITFTDPLTGVAYKEVFTSSKTANAACVDLANQVNGLVPGVTKSQFVSAVAGTATAITAAGPTAFTTGADGSAIAAGDWTNGLTAIEPYDVDLVVPVTGDATIHAQVTTHCLNMSAPLTRKERVPVYGGVLGETPAQATARATAAGIANRRGQLVYPGIQLFNAAGVITTYAPYMAAAHVAGLHANLPDPATSLTHQRLNVLGVERELSRVQGSDIDTLLRSNVTPIARADGGGYWITDSLSLEPTDPNFRDLHKVRSADEVAQRLRTATEGKWTGQKALNASAGSIALQARLECEAMKAEQLIRDYLPLQVQVTEIIGQPGRFALVAPVMLVDTVKFIGITVALQPASTLAGPATPDAF